MLAALRKRSHQSQSQKKAKRFSTVPGDVNTVGGAPKKKPGMDMFTILLFVAMGFLVFTMFRGPRKKQQEHRKMLDSLSKNDRVRTIGGIFGTIVDVREDEIILKVDESNNTKLRIAPSAIGTKISDDKNPA